MNLIKASILGFFLNFSFSLFVLAENNEQALEDYTARIKRISLMTQNLEESLNFFTMVIGFKIDFKGTLPPGKEPFLGPVFNIDTNKPINRALLSTSKEPRGLFLIEQKDMKRSSIDDIRSVVLVVEVDSLEKTLTRAKIFESFATETITDVTPEGETFSEAMILSPAGHAILVYQLKANKEIKNRSSL
tara:strand:+ start:56 stop:622 length:567 start_codon:yes stop_codon:yes gene_type:complete